MSTCVYQQYSEQHVNNKHAKHHMLLLCSFISIHPIIICHYENVSQSNPLNPFSGQGFDIHDQHDHISLNMLSIKTSYIMPLKLAIYCYTFQPSSCLATQ